jgi:hypothetical protein
MKTLEESDWTPGRWFRITAPDGALWMETSSESEARAEAKRTGWKLERQFEAHFAEWRDA